jgi:hypothetical protein
MKSYFILFVLLVSIVNAVQATETVLQLNQLPATYRAPANFDMKSEQWLYKAGSNVFLFGGEPRGTIYAIYHFLEDVNGIHWWTPWGEESVPASMATISGTPTLADIPAFVYRGCYSSHPTSAEKPFYARNRTNGHYTELGSDYGWNNSFGSPGFAHNLIKYVPSATYYSSHPEYYALMTDGNRSTMQLCLTNNDVYDIVLSKLTQYLAADRATALAGGHPMPYRYDLSLSDTGTYCHCPACTALMAAHGNVPSALTVSFVNSLGNAIKTTYPEVTLSLLAYRQTEIPPTNIQVADNVSIRIAGLNNNFALKFSENTDFDNNVQDWAAIAKNTSNWHYQTTFNNSNVHKLDDAAHNFVTVNLADDLRYCRDNGMKGAFIEHEKYKFSEVTWELDNWVAMKLMENPDLSLNALLDIFCEGYYGTTAGASIRQYISQIQTAAANPGNDFHLFNSIALDYSYINCAFVAEANQHWAAAEAAASGIQLQRVKNARMGFDRYVLHSGQRLLDEYAASHSGSVANFSTNVIDLYQAAQRCLTTLNNLPADRFPTTTFTTDKVNTEIAEMNELSANFANIAASSALPTYISNNTHFVFYPQDMRVYPGATDVEFTVDPNLATRQAMLTDWSYAGGVYDKTAPANRFHFSIPTISSFTYQWYEVGTGTIGTNDYMYLLNSWHLQLHTYGTKVLSTGSTNGTFWCEFRRKNATQVYLNRVAIVFNN